MKMVKYFAVLVLLHKAGIFIETPHFLEKLPMVKTLKICSKPHPLSCNLSGPQVALNRLEQLQAMDLLLPGRLVNDQPEILPLALQAWLPVNLIR